MTTFLIKTLSRYPLRRLARPSAVLAFTLVLAYGGGFWETLLHHVEGGHERNEPSLVLHWLRDATLALPLVFCAVWLGVLVARRLIERHGAERSRVVSAAVLAATVAWVDSMVVGLASPLHNTLFQAGHSGPHTPYLVHSGRDALLALAVNLPLAALVSAALLNTRPWAAPLVEAWHAAAQLGPALRPPGRAGADPHRSGGARGAERRSARDRGPDAGHAVPAAGRGRGQGLRRPRHRRRHAAQPLRRPRPERPHVRRRHPRRQRPEQAPAPGRRRPRRGAEPPRVDRPEGQRPDPAARHPREPRRLRPDQLHERRERRRVSACTSTASRTTTSPRATRSATTRRPTIGKGGGTRTYRYWVPRDPQMEGAHYIRPGANNRALVNHGLFGSLSVQPAGSKYLDMTTGEPIESGWQATIVPGDGHKAFREYNQVHHEIGSEGEDVFDGRRHEAAARRPAHDRLSPRHASDELSLRAVHEPSRQGAARGLPRLRLLHVRRPGDADAARVSRRSDEDPDPARRQRGLPRLPPPRRVDPLAAEPARGHDVQLREDGPGQVAEGAELAVLAPGLAVLRPGRVV